MEPSKTSLDRPCGCCRHCAPYRFLSFKVRSHKAIRFAVDSPETGIEFARHVFTANEIAKGFEMIMNRPVETGIRFLALERWKAQIPALVGTPELVDDTFDIDSYFEIFNDFFFHRALSAHRCWVSMSWKSWLKDNTDVTDNNFDAGCGPSTTHRVQTKKELLEKLLHNMIHALFADRCFCDLCLCEGRRASEQGLTGHGPAWISLRSCVENTANTHLTGFPEPWSLGPESVADMKKDLEAGVKFLKEGLRTPRRLVSGRCQSTDFLARRQCSASTYDGKWTDFTIETAGDYRVIGREAPG